MSRVLITIINIQQLSIWNVNTWRKEISFIPLCVCVYINIDTDTHIYTHTHILIYTHIYRYIYIKKI